MAVYVDKPRWIYRKGLWGHMVADSVEELHEFAKKLGLKPAYFQGKSFPHYDISTNKHLEARKLGAELIDSRDLLIRSRKLRTVTNETKHFN